MHVIETALAGVLIIEPRVFCDKRGFFKESYSARRYQDLVGINLPFVQDNQSRSAKGVLRGMHFQRQRPQGKLVSVARGAVYDVTVDIDADSPTFGQHVAIALTDNNHRQVWIPPGYAHGFCVVSDEADVHYKCTDYYCEEDEAGLAWDCPELAIDWPVSRPLVSDKDQSHPCLRDWLRLQEKS